MRTTFNHNENHGERIVRGVPDLGVTGCQSVNIKTVGSGICIFDPTRYGTSAGVLMAKRGNTKNIFGNILGFGGLIFREKRYSKNPKSRVNNGSSFFSGRQFRLRPFEKQCFRELRDF